MPDRNLKIAIFPIAIHEGDADANLKEVEQRIRTFDDDTDMIVLPEMFNTGFTSDSVLLARYAETNDGRTITALRHFASKHRIAIWGGFTANENGLYYNRGFMIDDGGGVSFYDKRHLFRYGGESDILTPGCELSPIISYRSWKLKMSLCYDIRFPVWNRAIANDYDVLVVPANWVHSRFFAWKHLLIARAIENQCFVIGCNREGADAYGIYREGDSMALNNWGDNISDTRADGIIYASLDYKTFVNDRERFSPWRDADVFNLEL